MDKQFVANFNMSKYCVEVSIEFIFYLSIDLSIYRSIDLSICYVSQFKKVTNKLHILQ